MPLASPRHSFIGGNRKLERPALPSPAILLAKMSLPSSAWPTSNSFPSERARGRGRVQARLTRLKSGRGADKSHMGHLLNIISRNIKEGLQYARFSYNEQNELCPLISKQKLPSRPSIQVRVDHLHPSLPDRQASSRTSIMLG